MCTHIYVEYKWTHEYIGTHVYTTHVHRHLKRIYANAHTNIYAHSYIPSHAIIWGKIDIYFYVINIFVAMPFIYLYIWVCMCVCVCVCVCVKMFPF